MDQFTTPRDDARVTDELISIALNVTDELREWWDVAPEQLERAIEVSKR